MVWPKNITLTKLSTRKDAKFPQEQKYPSFHTKRSGFMWEFSQPKVGNNFFVLIGKLNPIFVTSIVENIEIINEDLSILTTENSVYELKIEKNADY